MQFNIKEIKRRIGENYNANFGQLKVADHA